MQRQMSAPDDFDSKNPALWCKWLSTFQKYRMASRLSFKPKSQQISMLLYTLGDGGEHFSRTFKFADEDNLQ